MVKKRKSITPKKQKVVIIEPDVKVKDKPLASVKPKIKPIKLNLNKKRNRVIAGLFIGIIGLLIIFGLSVNHKNSTKINTYLNSKDFKSYSASMKSYLSSNNGIYPKAYTCSATLEQLWNPPVSPISKTKERLDVQLARQLIDLKPKWDKVSVAYPGYNHYLFFRLIPLDHGVFKKFQNVANLMDGTSKLVNHTQDYGYYCPGYLYVGISSFSYLDEYSKNKPITETVAVINQRMASLVAIGNTYKSAKTPADWSTTQKTYLSFLHKTLADLTTLRNQMLKTPAGVNMSPTFKADKTALQQAVTMATKTGQKVGPNQDKLAKYFQLAVSR